MKTLILLLVVVAVMWFMSPYLPTPTDIFKPSDNSTSILTSSPTSNLTSKINSLSDTDTSDYALRFNRYRQSEGCAPLVFIDDLNSIATLRLTELKTDFSHNSQYNRYLGENIVKGIYNNQEALNTWEGSPLHNANMIDPSYKYTGYAAGDGYAVQVFCEWNTEDGIPQLPPGWYFP